MARYDEPESQGVGSAEFHGLSGADLLGLSPSSHASMAMWRLQYSPQMWLGATTGQFKWGGSMLIGGGIPKSFLQGVSGQIGDKYGGRFAKKGLNIVGNFIGGWEGNLIDTGTQRLMREGGYNLFSRGGRAGLRGAYESSIYTTARGRMVRDAEIALRATGPTTTAQVKSAMYGSRGMVGEIETKAMQYANREASRLVSKNVTRLLALKVMGGANVVLTTAMLADLAANVAYGGIVATNALAQRLSTSNLLDMTSGANIVGAYGASTERQRALQAIQANNLNARRFIGSEGAMMHQ